ncbi:hypothetical protein LLE49_12620 [Alicyclobacillus tolerans]|uniref:3-hydroxyacyl-CoA dehydrogenase family protein n=1 Tax=Alicyclobacillus tolerans TaxID=90970 RepID=UPI002351ACBA|nr:3-hydroxyacyl-CoA dehydrogenase family protein [Alicyclobacillus tolerans]MCF8565561.1 hypothetical protein [Alicyclobacillus tolerans]
MYPTHFINPPHLIPLVEVVPNATTDRRFVDRVMAELYDCSFQPIVLNKEAPGFVANRLQGALFREVLNILEQGIADPEAIDTAVKMGVGFRWAVTGPLETADFGGLDTFALAAASLVPHLGTTTPVAVLQEKAQAGHLGVKSGKGFYDYTGVDTAELTEQRDRQLIRLKSLKS